MAKRKKRKSVPLILLLLVLVALIGLYYWYSNREKETEDKTDTETIQLAKLEDTSKLTNLHYRASDADMTLVKEGDVWKLEADPGRPINQDNVKGLIGVLTDISATRMVAEKPDNLADFGLAEPSGYLQGTLSDGTTVTLQIGNMIAAGNGYYALVNEDSKVYLLSTFYGTGLKYSNADMTAVAEAPTITAENINRIAIDNKDSDDFEIVNDMEGGVGNTGSYVYSWFILKPYKLGYTADSTKVGTLLENYTGFSYAKCIEYEAKDLSLYGLDQPMSTIDLNYTEDRTEKLAQPEKDPQTGNEITEKTYHDPKEYKLMVGNLDEKGLNYYVMDEGSKAVYTMSAETVNKMLTVDVFDLLNRFINIPNIDNVDRIDINLESTVYQITIDHKTVTNEDGKDVIQNTCYFNGTQANEQGFKDFYQILIGAKFDAEIKTEVNTKVAPRLTLSYQLNDAAKTVVSASYLPYDDSFYLVDTNGEIRFFADKRRMDDIIKAIQGFDPTKVPEE